MDELMAIAGAEPVDWAFKTECCGASHQISEPKGARRLIERVFEDAAAGGAEAIATACPLCMLNLDMRERELNTHRKAVGKEPFNIPVYYFTELLGVAMGGSMKQLGIDRHFWPAEDTASAAGKGETAEGTADESVDELASGPASGSAKSARQPKAQSATARSEANTVVRAKASATARPEAKSDREVVAP
jgi:heterodisulfide reductase subunit B